MTTSNRNSTSSSEAIGWLARRPWLWVVLAFVVLLSAWGVLFYIAMNNQPESIPLTHLVP